MKKLIGKTVNVDYCESIATSAATNMKYLKKVVLTGVDYGLGLGYCAGFCVFNDSIYINGKYIVKIELAE